MNNFILGVTGRSGSGKTYICDIFKSFGFYVINTDAIYHSLIENKTDCYIEIVSYFKSGILDENGFIDRKKLSLIVFNNDIKLKALNDISHKHILSYIKNFISKNNYNRIIIDAPLLFESGLNFICTKTLCLICDTDVAVNRIIKRDNINIQNAYLRLQNQKSNDFFLKNCDFVIYNNDYYFLNSEVENIINILEDKCT